MDVASRIAESRRLIHMSRDLLGAFSGTAAVSRALITDARRTMATVRSADASNACEHLWAGLPSWAAEYGVS